MAFFATVIDGIVTNVEVVSDEVSTNEAAGQEFLAALYGTESSVYVETFLTDETPYPRGKFAGIGDTWKPKPRTKDGGTFEPPVLPKTQ